MEFQMELIEELQGVYRKFYTFENKEFHSSVVLSLDKLPDQPEGMFIQGIYVPDKFRNKGIGTKSLQFCLDYCKKYFHEYPICLFAQPIEKCMSLSNLVKWYEKNGFVKLKQDSESEGWLMIYAENEEIKQQLLNLAQGK